MAKRGNSQKPVENKLPYVFSQRDLAKLGRTGSSKAPILPPKGAAICAIEDLMPEYENQAIVYIILNNQNRLYAMGISQLGRIVNQTYAPKPEELSQEAIEVRVPNDNMSEHDLVSRLNNCFRTLGTPSILDQNEIYNMIQEMISGENPDAILNRVIPYQRD